VPKNAATSAKLAICKPHSPHNAVARHLFSGNSPFCARAATRAAIELQEMQGMLIPIIIAARDQWDD
jgi:hypothetical protein